MKTQSGGSTKRFPPDLRRHKSTQQALGSSCSAFTPLDLTKKFLDFNDPDHNPKAFLRTPQFEALEVYVFLKEFLDNGRVQEIFKDWFDRAGKFAQRAEGGISNSQGQVSLFENVTRDQYKVVFEAMKRNRRV